MKKLLKAAVLVALSATVNAAYGASQYSLCSSWWFNNTNGEGGTGSLRQTKCVEFATFPPNIFQSWVNTKDGNGAASTWTQHYPLQYFGRDAKIVNMKDAGGEFFLTHYGNGTNYCFGTSAGASLPKWVLQDGSNRCWRLQLIEHKQ